MIDLLLALLLLLAACLAGVADRDEQPVPPPVDGVVHTLDGALD